MLKGRINLVVGGGGCALDAVAPPKPQLRLIPSYNKSEFNQHCVYIDCIISAAAVCVD